MEIKIISNNDMTAAIKLITEVFMEFEAPDYTEEGVDAFFETALHNPKFMRRLVVYGAYIEKSLVGVLATRNEGTHIALFFVDGAYQQQGIGKSLFKTALEHCKAKEMTVNASPYAKEIYHHLGFIDTDEEQTINGIRFIPMKYNDKV